MDTIGFVLVIETSVIGVQICGTLVKPASLVKGSLSTFSILTGPLWHFVTMFWPSWDIFRCFQVASSVPIVSVL